MVTFTVEEIAGKPDEVETRVQGGERVVVTNKGEPIFEAVPLRKSAAREFGRKIDKIWEGTNHNWTNDQVIDLIRDSRE